MAVIGAIRKRSILLLIIIGAALLTFILTDFFSNRGGNQQRVPDPLAIIEGEKISIDFFDSELNQQLENIAMRDPEFNPSRSDIFELRNRLFDELVNEYVLLKQAEKIGLAIDVEHNPKPGISNRELTDMLYGAEPHPQIVQAFTNQSGNFDKSAVKNYMDQITTRPLDEQNQWSRFIDDLRKIRLQTKYNNLIVKSYYTPTALAEIDFIEANESVQTAFVFKSYETVPDSLITLTDDDYELWWKENKKRFERDAQATIEYVVFDVIPTREDVAAIEREMIQLKSDFEKPVDPQAFLMAHSHQAFDSTYIKKGTLEPLIDSIMFSSEPGTIYGPYVSENAYHMIKLIDTQIRPDSIRTSHILITYENVPNPPQQGPAQRTYSEAEELADSLLSLIKNSPSLFESIARQQNDDQTAAIQSGDIGWKADGEMPAEYNEASIKNSIGTLKLVESDMGFHIMKTTGFQSMMKKIRVAKITKEILPSQETQREIYTKASRFMSSAENTQQLEKAAEENGYNINEATLSVDQYEVHPRQLPDSRDIIQWAFRKDTDTGSISNTVFDYNGLKYVVVALQSKNEKGIPALNKKMKEDIKVLVIKDKKHQYISNQIAKANASDLKTLSAKMNLPLDTAMQLTFSMTTIPRHGPEPYVIGKMVSYPVNKLSNPIKGVNGVYVFTVFNKMEAQMPESIAEFKNNRNLGNAQLLSNSIQATLKEIADVEDNRLQYF